MTISKLFRGRVASGAITIALLGGLALCTKKFIIDAPPIHEGIVTIQTPDAASPKPVSTQIRQAQTQQPEQDGSQRRHQTTALGNEYINRLASVNEKFTRIIGELVAVFGESRGDYLNRLSERVQEPQLGLLRTRIEETLHEVEEIGRQKNQVVDSLHTLVQHSEQRVRSEELSLQARENLMDQLLDAWRNATQQMNELDGRLSRAQETLQALDQELNLRETTQTLERIAMRQEQQSAAEEMSASITDLTALSTAWTRTRDVLRYRITAASTQFDLAIGARSSDGIQGRTNAVMEELRINGGSSQHAQQLIRDMGELALLNVRQRELSEAVAGIDLTQPSHASGVQRLAWVRRVNSQLLQKLAEARELIRNLDELRSRMVTYWQEREQRQAANRDAGSNTQPIAQLETYTQQINAAYSQLDRLERQAEQLEREITTVISNTITRYRSTEPHTPLQREAYIRSLRECHVWTSRFVTDNPRHRLRSERRPAEDAFTELTDQALDAGIAPPHFLDRAIELNRILAQQIQRMTRFVEETRQFRDGALRRLQEVVDESANEAHRTRI